MTDKFYGGIKAGTTNISVPVTLRYTANNISLIGMDYANVEMHYLRQGSNTTIVTATELTNPDNVHQDGGFIEANVTSIPGLYRVDWPDTAFATGVDFVVLHVANVSASYHSHTLYALQENVDLGSIRGNVESAVNLANSTLSITIGIAEAGTLSPTEMTSDVGEATDNHYVGKIITWTSGVLYKQSSNVSAYLGSTGKFTYSTVTDSPSAGDSFVVT